MQSSELYIEAVVLWAMENLFFSYAINSWQVVYTKDDIVFGIGYKGKHHIAM